MSSEAVTPQDFVLSKSKPLPPLVRVLLAIAALAVVAVMVWVFLTSAGAPDPTRIGISPTAAILDIGVLVFREGLECVLVLSAITASMVGVNQHYRKAVALGAAFGALATIVTWFTAIRIVHDLSVNLDALQVQAWTGLLAIIVLLIVMNWFFHKLYWGGWISMHNRKKKQLLASKKKEEISTVRLLWGLGLLGFASFYREGFEIVLFLQSYNLKLGSHTVYMGMLVGTFFASVVAVLAFIAHHKLPYRKMLQLTGILLGVVLMVMVGEQAQEMQIAHWIPTTTISWLQPYLPDWLGLWFSIFPTAETLGAQAVSAAFVVASFFLAKKQSEKEALLCR
jgi:high-affinity iron transporter